MDSIFNYFRLFVPFILVPKGIGNISYFLTGDIMLKGAGSIDIFPISPSFKITRVDCEEL